MSGTPKSVGMLAIVSVLTALALVVLDSAIANVALPTIAMSLHATPAMSVRVITSYQLALVVTLLPGVALGESLGYRRVFLVGVGLFTAASGLCALAPSLPWLVAARFVQGFGGAAAMSLGIALLRLALPQHKLGPAIGWNAVVVALSSAAGPTIGAAILSIAPWPWLFAVNLPLGIVAVVAGRALPSLPGTGRRLDLISVSLNVVGFAGLVFGAELLPIRAAQAGLLFCASAVFLAALVHRELPKPAPLIPFDLLRSGSFRISIIASVCCFTGQTAGLVALPFYLQHGLQQSVLMTGLYMTAWPLGMAATAPIAGRLTNLISTAWLCAIGGAVLAVGLIGASLWPVKGNPAVLVPFMALSGIGFGLFNVPNNRNMFLTAPRVRMGAAGGMQGTARLTGQTAGAVIMTLLFMLTPLANAPRIGLWIGAVMTLIAGAVSTLRAGNPAFAAPAAQDASPTLTTGQPE